MASQKTVLYDDHIKAGAVGHMADFAGYSMPLWYSSISDEHKAVRNSAGLFDCTHMGIFEISGPYAQDFLNIISTNNIESLKINRAQYSYLLDKGGDVLDDIIIYKISDENFMVVVNAGNEAKVRAWLNCVADDKSIVESKPTIIDLRSSKAGEHQRVDIALQGPASLECLNKLARDNISDLKPFTFIQTQINNIDIILSRTGYTGAKIGFELYVHPEKASQVWNLVLEQGSELGIIPCGLGSRDSLRIEAGLPLYGHELAGGFNISPFEAGYGWAVKTDKSSFIGKDAIVEKQKSIDKQVTRFEFAGRKGVRPLRQSDGILDDDGNCIGWILSCAKIEDKQIAIAYILSDKFEENGKVGGYYLARSQSQINKGKKDSVSIGDKLESDVSGIMVSRFERF